MPKRKQHIGHTQSQADLFTGLDREVTVDTTNKELRVHDGATVGGTRVARKDLANVDVATAGNAGKMSASQAADLAADKATLAAHVGAGGSAHSQVTGAVDGFMIAADKTKLDGIETAATADQTPAELLTAIKTVDGAGSLLDADLLDGVEAASFTAAINAVDSALTTEENTTAAHRAATGTAVHGLGAASILGVATGGVDSLLRADGKGNLLTDLATNSALAALFSGVQKDLTLSNSLVDTLHDIKINSGIAVNDAGTRFLVLGSALIKRLDANWVVGNNQGGLDTGTIAANTWYHVWIISRSDTGVVDILFSTSATAPTMPTNYNQRCRIGAILTDATPNIIGFSQYGDEFLWNTSRQDLNGNITTTASLITASVPLGIKVKALLYINVTSGTSGPYGLYVTSPDQTDQTASIAAGRMTVYKNGTNDAASAVDVRTNTSSQYRIVSNLAGGIPADGITLGWIDPRGRI